MNPHLYEKHVQKRSRRVLRLQAFVELIDEKKDQKWVCGGREMDDRECDSLLLDTYDPRNLTAAELVRLLRPFLFDDGERGHGPRCERAEPPTEEVPA